MRKYSLMCNELFRNYPLKLMVYNVPEFRIVFYLDAPIIGIWKGNESELIINETQTGEVCGFNSNDIIELLEKAVQQKVRFSPQKEKIKFFTRKNQARILGSIIQDLLN